jgi:hypothetical protein
MQANSETDIDGACRHIDHAARWPEELTVNEVFYSNETRLAARI